MSTTASPNFSRIGQKIALSYHQHDHGTSTHQRRRHGAVRITETPWSVTAAGKPVWNNVAPAYSPDNRRIAFLDRSHRPVGAVDDDADGSPRPISIPPSVQTQARPSSITFR